MAGWGLTWTKSRLRRSSATGLPHRWCNLQTMTKNQVLAHKMVFWKTLKELKLSKKTYVAQPTESPPTLASPQPPTLRTTEPVATCRFAAGATSAWSHAVQVNST